MSKITASTCAWPQVDEQRARVTIATMVIQINGKTRTSFTVTRDADAQTVEKEARIVGAQWLEAKTVKTREIFVPNRLINFVIE